MNQVLSSMTDEEIIQHYIEKENIICEQYDGDDEAFNKKIIELQEQYVGTIVEKYLQEAEEDLDEEPLTLEEIMQIEDANDFTIAYMDYLNDKCEYGEGMDVLTEQEKTVYYVDTMNSEVHSKGFKEYLQSNDFPGFEVLENALQMIGASAVHEIVKDAEKKPKWMSFNKIDDRFYEYPDNIQQLIMDYVKKGV